MSKKALGLLSVGAVLLILAAASGCSDKTAATFQSPQGVAWTSDGRVTPGEYENHLVLSEFFTLNWNSDGKYIYVAMEGTSPYSPGYVALGFTPADWTAEMKKTGSDMIIGFVAGGVAYATDAMSIDKLTPHPADDRNDVEQLSGSVTGNTTIIEFCRKLDTGDSKDQKLEIGLNRIMWAVGFNPTDSGAHPAGGRGYAEIEIK
ncbi:DOMON domain-containing protein [Dehalogenimonas alkenigignens]|uniref:DOMON domain n=1 Tax=Dehalogenimonas alkenigignens TaxID=1217799 RepID=A0A0W0GGP8_9CHLR|nr:DOMON domain-containing protein [Dehalogenimonas alkenigignens]KTB47709.1 DOMON domain [Dehalogenimonas alkenigignens]PVV84025.1 hypothetical protein DD509_04975 [Dehalogenimonas alkenigignens]